MLKTAVKTIPFQEAMKICKNFVSKSETRPILQLVKYDGSTFTATNSHVLIRINAAYVSDIPEYVNNEFLFDPKQMLIDNDYNVNSYPNTSRLIPDYSYASDLSTVLLNKENMKAFQEQLKAIKSLNRKRDFKIVKLDFSQNYTEIYSKVKTDENNEETKNHYGLMKNMHVEGKDISLHANDQYLLYSLEAAKKLSKLNDSHTEMRIISRVRPIHFRQYDVFDILVLPIRVS